MSNINIRKATLFDAEAIAAVHIDSWKQAYQDFIPEEILNNLSLIERTRQWSELLNSGVVILAIEIDEQIIGFASLCTFRDEVENKSQGEISAIYLHPKYWHKGYGAQLCTVALKMLQAMGYAQALLWVLSDNLQARSFYERLGFQLTGTTRLEEMYEGSALLSEVLYAKKLQ